MGDDTGCVASADHHDRAHPRSKGDLADWPSLLRAKHQLEDNQQGSEGTGGGIGSPSALKDPSSSQSPASKLSERIRSDVFGLKRAIRQSFRESRRHVLLDTLNGMSNFIKLTSFNRPKAKKQQSDAATSKWACTGCRRRNRSHYRIRFLTSSISSTGSVRSTIIGGGGVGSNRTRKGSMFLGSGAARGLLKRMGRVQTSEETTAMLGRRTSVTGAEASSYGGSGVTQPLLPKRESPVSLIQLLPLE